MEKVQVKVIGRSFRRKAPGGVLYLSRRDARILSSLGRVEIVSDGPGRSTYVVATDRSEAEAAEVEFTASDKLDDALQKPKRRKKALKTPEAPLETVAHTDAPKRRTSKRGRKGKAG